MNDRLPPCGERGCVNPHPAKPWADRPIARRLAALEPQPVEDRRPAWLRNLSPKDMTGSLR